MWQCHPDGRIRLEITSLLPEASAFDGLRGTHVGPSGVLESLDLADLDELRMTSALFSGGWLDPNSPLVLERGSCRGDTIIVGARVGPEEWRQPFRIVLATGSLQPMRLETLSGAPAIFDLEGFAPGVFCDVPRRLRWRRGWLADTIEIARVEGVSSSSSYALVDARGERARSVRELRPCSGCAVIVPQ